MRGFANRMMYNQINVIPELLQTTSKYYQKCMTCEPKHYESSCREYKRITNFNAHLIKRFPNFREDLKDAQQWFKRN
jgi:hypothetical protein